MKGYGLQRFMCTGRDVKTTVTTWVAVELILERLRLASLRGHTTHGNL